MLIVKDIEFHSLCEHHILPFFGKIAIGYIPDGNIVGLSKIARAVDVFARRLQVQERMTRQICDLLTRELSAKGVIVFCEATHMCMRMRGVEKECSTTQTIEYSGVFEKIEYRQEFLSNNNAAESPKIRKNSVSLPQRKNNNKNIILRHGNYR